LEVHNNYQSLAVDLKKCLSLSKLSLTIYRRMQTRQIFSGMILKDFKEIFIYLCFNFKGFQVI